MESGLSAASDVGCGVTFVGLDVISRASLKDLLAKHLVAFILHASYSGFSKQFSHLMLIGLKFHHKQALLEPRGQSPES